MGDSTTARFVMGFFLICVLSSCGEEPDICVINCFSVFKPHPGEEVRDLLSCDDCKARFWDLRESLCGPTPTVGCICSYACGQSNTTL